MIDNENKLVFIVDDDPIFLKGLSEFLLREIPGLKVKTFATGEACMHEMHLNPMAVVLDYYLNAEFPYAWSGMQVLKKIDDSFPATRIIIMSAQKNVETAIECLRQGAIEYVTKNEKALHAIKDILMNVVDDAIEY